MEKCIPLIREVLHELAQGNELAAEVALRVVETGIQETVESLGDRIYRLQYEKDSLERGIEELRAALTSKDETERKLREEIRMQEYGEWAHIVIPRESALDHQIQTIKEVRKLTGMSLYQAKEVVDAACSALRDLQKGAEYTHGCRISDRGHEQLTRVKVLQTAPMPLTLLKQVHDLLSGEWTPDADGKAELIADIARRIDIMEEG